MQMNLEEFNKLKQRGDELAKILRKDGFIDITAEVRANLIINTVPGVALHLLEKYDHD